ncbi:MAG: oxidoreductase [Elusimicrobia bacterium]|nr:oxidoreductase [Elusimicrobiota bacterium]
MKTAAVAGATGLVGGFVLRRLLEDPGTGRVIAPTRRPLAAHPKLENPILASGWPELNGLDEAYGCLGTTRKDAGSAAAFRAVDLDLAVAFARAAKTGGARSFGLVSSAGADAGSAFLYPRVKGEAEAAVGALGFETVVIARPSLLLGERVRPRPAERLGEAALALASPFLVGPLRKYRAISADAVAAALIASVRGRIPGKLTLESDALGAHLVE